MLTITSPIGDNGIIFAVTDLEGDGEFWEIDADYYFLFPHSQGLYLGKSYTEDGRKSWKSLASYEASSEYSKENANTVKVQYDKNGHIKCYLNGELVIDYVNNEPLEGSLYGIRAGSKDAIFENISIVKN